MRMNLDHVASGHFVLGRDVHCKFDSWPLAVSMPPTKVCPQCKAAVPVRRKTCECCDHVFRSKRKAECNLREKAMKRMRAVESDSVKSARKAKVSCTRHVKERQKLVSKLCICMMSNNHNILHCVNIGPKCLAVRTDSRTDS